MWRGFTILLQYDNKVAEKKNEWTKEEMVGPFLDSCFESQDAKDFIMDKFPGEGDCPV